MAELIFPLRIGIIKSRFHYFRGQNLIFWWFLDFPTLGTPYLWLLLYQNTSKNIWKYMGTSFKNIIFTYLDFKQNLEGTQLCALLVIDLFRSEGRGDGRYFRYPSKLTGKNPSAKPGMVKGGGRLSTHALLEHTYSSRLLSTGLVTCTVNNYT